VSAGGFSGSDSASAWHGFFGWFGAVLAVIGAALVTVSIFAPRIRVPVSPRLGALGAFALATISTLLALLVVPDGTVNGATIDSGSSDTDAGHGFAYWIVLIVVTAALMLCFLRLQQTGGRLLRHRAPADKRGARRPRPY
jgi:thiosulfate reductase cytochrome b subunit